MGIIRTLSRQRLAELAQRERIAAIEPGSWAPGPLFAFVGIALMISSRIGRPGPTEVRRP